MAQFYLINRVLLGTRRLLPGALIDSTQDDVAAIQAVGGFLVDSADPTIASAAALATSLGARGQNIDAAFIMLAASAKSSSGDVVVTDLASTAASKGASLVSIQDALSIITATTVEGALAEIRLLSPFKRTVTVGHADLTNAVAGASQAINIGATLPANARILYVDAHDFTPYSGGGATAVTLDVGTTGDPNAIVAGADVFAAAVDGGPSTLPYGIRPNKLFATVGAQLLATFTPDGGASLDGLTAGSVIVDVFYFVAA